MFVKGKSGNPTGRTKHGEMYPRLKMRCRDVTDEVIDYWLEQVRSEGPEAFRASCMLMAYGWGKPAEIRMDDQASKPSAALLEIAPERLLELASGQASDEPDSDTH